MVEIANTVHSTSRQSVALNRRSRQTMISGQLLGSITGRLDLSQPKYTSGKEGFEKNSHRVDSFLCPSGKEDLERSKKTPYDDTRVDMIFGELLGVYKPHKIGSFTCSSIGIGLNSNKHRQPTSIDIDSDDDDACDKQSRRVMLVADETPSEPPGLDLSLNGNPHKPPGLGPSLTSNNNGGTVKIPSEPPGFGAFSSLNGNDIDTDGGHGTY